MTVLRQVEPGHDGNHPGNGEHAKTHTYDEAVKSFGDTYAIEINSPPSPAKRSLNLPEIKLNSYSSSYT